MSATWVICAATLVVVLGVAALVLLAQRRTTRDLDSARAESAVLRERLDVLERSARETRDARETRVEASEHLITVLGHELDERPDDELASPAVPAPLFADLVLREGVVQAVSLVAGVRRALAPEQRHRIRLEMRREVKRARKQRRADLREARRDLADRQRSGTARGESAA